MKGQIYCAEWDRNVEEREGKGRDKMRSEKIRKLKGRQWNVRSFQSKIYAVKVIFSTVK